MAELEERSRAEELFG
jgi:hypothetical protein